MRHDLAPRSGGSWVALALLACLGYAGCGPAFETQYNFTPPPTSEGKTCAFQCDNSRLQCRQLEDYRAQDCQRQSEWDRRQCEEDIYRRKGREPKWYECGGSSCNTDYERCEGLYRSCYQSCGGRIDAQRVCVSGCDQLTPDQRRAPMRPNPRDDYRPPVKAPAPRATDSITPRTY